MMWIKTVLQFIGFIGGLVLQYCRSWKAQPVTAGSATQVSLASRVIIVTPEEDGMAKPAKAKTPTTSSGFNGFKPAAMTFFKDLSANQSREWFHDNKAHYEQLIREPMGQLLDALTFAFSVHDIPLQGDAKTSMFRINRDVRFSNDKRPYKTNVSAVLTRDGTKHNQGLVYIQLGPDECFVAAGFYGLEPDALEAFRRHILTHRSKWQKLAADLDTAGYAFSRQGAAIRLPRGYDAKDVGALGDDIRLKSFTIHQPLTQRDIKSTAIIDKIIALAKTAEPLLRFGWSALASLPLERK